MCCRQKNAPLMVAPNNPNNVTRKRQDTPRANTATNAIAVAIAYADSLLQHAANVANTANGKANTLPCNARTIAMACASRKPTANKSNRFDGQSTATSANGPSANRKAPATTALARSASARNNQNSSPALAKCKAKLIALCAA